MALSAKEKLEKLLEFVNKEEDLRTELSVKAMEEGSIMAMRSEEHTSELQSPR